MTTLYVLIEKLVKTKGMEYFVMKQAVRDCLSDITISEFTETLEHITEVEPLRQLLACGLRSELMELVYAKMRNIKEERGY